MFERLLPFITYHKTPFSHDAAHMSQPMRLWYLSHRRSAKIQASLRIRAVSIEPSLFAHMHYGRKQQRVRPKIRHLTPLHGCSYAFEEWAYDGQNVQ